MNLNDLVGADENFGGITTLAAVVTFAGLCLVAAQRPRIMEYHDIQNRGVSTTGQVTLNTPVKQNNGRSGNSIEYADLSYRFSYQDRPYSGDTRVSMSDSPNYPKGAGIEVLFDPQNPNNNRAMIDKDKNGIPWYVSGWVLLVVPPVLYGGYVLALSWQLSSGIKRRELKISAD